MPGGCPKALKGCEEQFQDSRVTRKGRWVGGCLTVAGQAVIWDLLVCAVNKRHSWSEIPPSLSLKQFYISIQCGIATFVWKAVFTPFIKKKVSKLQGGIKEFIPQISCILMPQNFLHTYTHQPSAHILQDQVKSLPEDGVWEVVNQVEKEQDYYNIRHYVQYTVSNRSLC